MSTSLSLPPESRRAGTGHSAEGVIINWVLEGGQKGEVVKIIFLQVFGRFLAELGPGKSGAERTQN